jgi:hypothetical protein
MKALLRKCPDGAYRPTTEADADALQGIPVGGYVKADPKQPRHPEHHKLAFVLLHTMFDNQDGFDSFDRWYDWCKVKAGLVDLVEMTDTGPVYKLQSLSFASMDQLQFRKAYDAILGVAAEMGIEIGEFA